MRRNRMIFIVMGCMLCCLAGCRGSSKGPDIRKVKLEIAVDHFEKDLFALDSNHLATGLTALKTKYGRFYEDFLYNIAAFSMDDELLPGDIKRFIVLNQTLYDHINEYIPHLDRELKKIENALKRAKIYFPALSLPNRIITYIGPMDGFGCFSSRSGLCVGLQQFLGEKYPGYQSDYLVSLFGAQRIRQFAPAYIAPATIASWIAKLFPDKAGQFTLQDKMLEEGRKAFVLKALLPNLEDSLIFGYSGQQMEWCQGNSYVIKRYFEQEDLLKLKKPELIMEYFSDNQRPVDLPKYFPNNIGKYIGYLYVKSYMENHRKTDLPELMKVELWEIKS